MANLQHGPLKYPIYCTLMKDEDTQYSVTQQRQRGQIFSWVSFIALFCTYLTALDKLTISSPRVAPDNYLCGLSQIPVSLFRKPVSVCWGISDPKQDQNRCLNFRQLNQIRRILSFFDGYFVLCQGCLRTVVTVHGIVNLEIFRVAEHFIK